MSEPPSAERDPRGRKVSPAVYASNWWVVLTVDALMGVVVMIAGAVLWALWTPWVGLPVAVAGLVYVLFVGRRALQWRWLRRQGGRA